MNVLNIPAIYSRWVSDRGANGALGDTAILAVAISLAESGGDTDIVSPSYDYGLWQINIIHAAQFPHLWPRWSNGYANARMARVISGNGQDWGPWCTAWADPRNCGHYLGPRVQAGSPAAAHLHHVAAVIGSHAPDPQELAGGNLADHVQPGKAGWARWQHIFGPAGRSWDDDLNHSLHYLKGVGR